MPPRRLASRGRLGPSVIVLLVVGLAALWAVSLPAAANVGSYVGQLLGAESVLVLSIALVLISTLPWVEVWFDGIDRAAIWHRRLAITGFVLLVPHAALAEGESEGSWGKPAAVLAMAGLAALVVWSILPRWRSVLPAPARDLVLAAHEWPPARLLARLLGNYEIWRAVHRTTGLFVAIGFAHGLVDATPFREAPVLRWTYVVAGGVGLAFYAYRELWARRGTGPRDYQVHEVRTVGPGLTEISLRPLSRPLTFVAGQFAMVFIEAKDGWHRHPFTLASAPSDPILKVTVKALGDYTSRLSTLVEPGMPAIVAGPLGRFTHAKGTDRQVWIAGGVGVTPFLSWLRALDDALPRGRVEFFYSVSDDEVPYEDEILQLVAGHPQVSAHLLRSRSDGRVDAERVLAPYGGDPTGVSVFLCGPEQMVRALQTGLRQAGVARHDIHREHFDWR